jgi:hypothetical protein
MQSMQSMQFMQFIPHVDFNIKEMSGTISFTSNKRFVRIDGKVLDNVMNSKLSFIASSPPDRHASFTGSGLPFPSAKHAFEGTPNTGIISLPSAKSFSIEMETPNAYYAGLGSLYIYPSIYFRYHNGQEEKEKTLTIYEGIPYRSLTYPWQRTSCRFYTPMRELPVRSQEEILRQSAYPQNVQVPAQFWNGKPPV